MKIKDIVRHLEYAETPAEGDLSKAYGRALQLMTFASKRREQSLKSIAANLWPAIRLRQIEFLYSSHGQVIAFGTWAWLTESVVEAMTTEDGYELHISEWNEGDQLWIVDIFAPYGDARNMVRKMRNLHFPHADRARALRRYGDGKAPRAIDIVAVRPSPRIKASSS
jgi:cytolysin-activating lysine-acyltransferase